jgi:uncharacterized membrane protein YfcA
MRRGDRVLGFICLALSLWLILESTKYDYVTRFTPGPGFLPFWLGILLGLLSLYLILDTFRRKKTQEEEKSRLPGKKVLLRVGLIIFFVAAFAFFMNSLGFVVTVFLSVALILLVLEGYGILKSLSYGIFFSFSIFLIFRYWLEVDLPKGFLGL